MDKRELAKLGTSSWDKLRKAIKAGDKDASQRLLDVTFENAQKMRGVLTDAINIALSTLAEEAGEEAVHRAMRQFYVRDVKPFLGSDMGDLDAVEKLKRRAHAWTEGHGVPIEIEEDEEKYILHIPCDTGGRIVGRGGFGKTKTAYPWSGGKKGVGYYCTHCPISFELACVEEGRHPWWITLPPVRKGQQCRQYIYKRAEDIPLRYYRRLGYGKPTPQTRGKNNPRAGAGS